MLTLTVVAILLVAVFAHLAGRSPMDEPSTLIRALDSRAMVAAVFLATFVVLWISWAAWNPIPVVHDEMAYVLQAQIFARGKWSLPSPPIPAFWEQPHVLVEPSLGAKYFPGHSLVMAIGALIGWMPLMPLALQAIVGALLYVLARRVASGGVALLTWVIWLFAPMTLYYGPSYFSEGTTTACWLGGWYALLEWRSSRKLHWLLAVAFFTGWDAITRPLTGLAYAIPVGVIIVYDVIKDRRWRDFALAFAMGVTVMAILPIWSAHVTGDWRITPQTLYTRMYMPYDVPGFGLVTDSPTHSITPDLQRLNNAYSRVHVTHFPSALPETLRARAQFLAVSIWGGTRGVVGVFALLGLFALSGATAFAVISSILLILMYLLYAAPPRWSLYHYESVPALAYLSAAGIAWAASLIGRPVATAISPAFGWRSRRWARALLVGAVALAIPGMAALQMIRVQHGDDRRKLGGFDNLLASIHDRRAIVFVRYAPAHDANTTFVRNVANLQEERIWVVYDRGDAENARLVALAPERKAYLFDELSGHTYVYDPGAKP
jgi:hypothetical protein